MKYNRKTVLLHGGREVKVLKPLKKNNDITITDNGKGYYYILANNIGYAYLKDFFLAVLNSLKDEILYFPTDFIHKDAYNKWFPESHFKGIIAYNYCNTQIKAKDLLLAINAGTINSETIVRNPNFETLFLDHWKTKNRLTIKKNNSYLIISTNEDGFMSLANSCNNLSKYEDDPEYNDFPPHFHHDWKENTSKSIGITFYHWHCENCDCRKV